MAGTNDYWSQASRDINKMMGSSSGSKLKSMANMQPYRQVSVFDSTMKMMGQISNKNIRATGEHSIKAVQNIVNQISKIIENSFLGRLKRLKKQAGITLLDANGNDPIMSLIPDELVSPRRRGARRRGRGGGSGDDIDVARVTGQVLEQLSSSLVKILPSLVAFTSVAGFIGAIIGKVMGLSDATSKLYLELGGTQKAYLGLVGSFGKYEKDFNLFQDQIEGLSKSFVDAGVRSDRLKENFSDLVEASQYGIRVFDLTTDSVSQFVRTLQYSGMSTKDVNADWDESYKMMLKFGLSTRDVNSAIEDGTDAWVKYGGALGRSLLEFKRGSIESKAALKSMNMDAKEASKGMADVWGDIELRKRQATYIASMSGGNAVDVFNQLSDPNRAGESLKLRARSGLNFIGRYMGQNAGTLATGVSGLSGDAQYQAIASRDYALQVAEKAGFPRELMEKVLGNFQASMQKQGGLRPGQNVFDAMQTFGLGNLSMPTKEDHLKDIADAVTTWTKDMPSETIKKMEREIEAFFTLVATHMWPFISKCLDNLDYVTQWIYGQESNFEKIIDWFMGAHHLLESLTKPHPMSGIMGQKDASIWERGFNNVGQLNQIAQGGDNDNPMKPWVQLGTGQWGNLKNTWDKSYGADFLNQVGAVAAKHGMSPADLMGIMKFESGVNSQSQNKTSGATGLIQFMNAAALGTTKKALMGMTREQQMPYVDKYLTNTVGDKKLGSLQDAYMAVLWPKAVGHAADYILWKAGSVEYKQNIGLDPLIGGHRKGYVTAGMATAMVAARLNGGTATGGGSDHATKVLDHLKGINDKLDDHQAILKKDSATKEQIATDLRRKNLASDTESQMNLAAMLAGAF